MRRFRLAATWVAMIGLVACQGRTPTAPSGGTGNSPASVVLHDDSGSLSAQLTASPSTISSAQSSTLTWTTNDADSAYLDGVQVARSGSKTVSPSATTTYTLVAVDGDHRVSSSATVTVSGSGSSGGSTEHVEAHLVASPTTIQPGQSSTLTWTTDDADHAYLNGVEVSRYGSKTVSPASTTTYTLVAVNGTLKDSSSVTVTVSGTAPPPVAMPTASLTPPSATITSGQSVTLTWSTTNATSVTMNGVAVAANGSQSYSPTVTTTYSLVASNSAGSVTDTTTVTVNAPAPPPVAMPTATLMPPSATTTSR